MQPGPQALIDALFLLGRLCVHRLEPQLGPTPGSGTRGALSPSPPQGVCEAPKASCSAGLTPAVLSVRRASICQGPLRVSGEGKGLLHLWVIPGVALDSARSPRTRSGLAPPGRPCRGALPSARLGQHPRPPQAGQGSQAGLHWVVGPGWASVSPAPRSWLGSSELPTACLRHCPRQSCRLPSRAAGPAASDLGQGGGWTGAEAVGTKRGLSGLGPGRRLRPCSAASEGPVFQSQAAGSPAQAQETALLFQAFFPSLRAPGGRCTSVSPLCPGVGQGPEVSVCPAPAWGSGTPLAGVLACTDRALPRGWPVLVHAGPRPHPRTDPEDRALRPLLPPGLARPGAGPPHPRAELGGPPDLHDVAGTGDMSGMWAVLGGGGRLLAQECGLSGGRLGHSAPG